MEAGGAGQAFIPVPYSLHLMQQYFIYLASHESSGLKFSYSIVEVVSHAPECEMFHNTFGRAPPVRST